jgi:hypothetical protein
MVGSVHIVTSRWTRAPPPGRRLYPILDRFEWENSCHCDNSGLWDVIESLMGNAAKVRADWGRETRTDKQDGYAARRSDVSTTSCTSRANYMMAIGTSHRRPSRSCGLGRWRRR